MRIGTWNLENKPLTGRSLELLRQQYCDVWLLTEVPPDTQVPGFHVHVSQSVMELCGQHWAGVLGREPLEKLPDPHPASAAVKVHGITFCSSILPWRTCGAAAPWSIGSQGAKTAAAVTSLLGDLPRTNLVWGGDWNHELVGPLRTGSTEGRAHILSALRDLNLIAHTTELPAQKRKFTVCNSIDHIAVPAEWQVHLAFHVEAVGLSDHDAYVVEVQPS